MKRHRAQAGEVSVFMGGHRTAIGSISARPTRRRPRMRCSTPKPGWCSWRHLCRCTPSRGSVSGEGSRGRLNAEGIPTRKQSARWSARGRMGHVAQSGLSWRRRFRQDAQGPVESCSTGAAPAWWSCARGQSIGHERPRAEWIEITGARAGERREFRARARTADENKLRSRRRTIAPSVVQGLVSCQKCGYAFSRTSHLHQRGAQIDYYKCIGSDSWRKRPGGPVCDKPHGCARHLLDQIVWTEVIRLLEDPALIQQELDRRLAAARSSDPTKQREKSSQGAYPRRQKHRRVTAHRLSRGTLVTRATARAHALAAATRTDTAGRVAGNCRPGCRSRHVPALGRDPCGVPRSSATALPTRLTSLSASESCAWSSRTSSSATTLSSSGIAFLSVEASLHSGPATPSRAPGTPGGHSFCFCVRGVSGEILADAPAVLGRRARRLPASVIGLFHGAFQPHLDQMQHPPIHNASRERAHQFGMWNRGTEIVREVGVHDFRMAVEQRVSSRPSPPAGRCGPAGRRIRSAEGRLRRSVRAPASLLSCTPDHAGSRCPAA